MRVDDVKALAPDIRCQPKDLPQPTQSCNSTFDWEFAARYFVPVKIFGERPFEPYAADDHSTAQASLTLCYFNCLVLRPANSQRIDKMHNLHAPLSS
jgi:hypothetical protein